MSQALWYPFEITQDRARSSDDVTTWPLTKPRWHETAWARSIFAVILGLTLSYIAWYWT